MHLSASAGGVDRYFHGLTSALAKRGIPFTGCGFARPNDPPTSPTWLRSLGSVHDPIPKRMRAIRSITNSAEAQMLVSHFSLYALPATFGRRGLPHVVHFHGPWAGESAAEGQQWPKTLAKQLVEQWVYRRADRFVVLSQAFRGELARRYRVDDCRIRVVPGGVETDRFQMRDRMGARARLGWNPNERVVICVRRLARRMGLETLIAAFAQIASRHDPVRLVIAGKGALQEELRAQAAASGAGGRIEFSGFVADADLPWMYAAADVSIVPTVALEGFGLICLESMACGTPALVTPVGGLPETVVGLEGDSVLAGSDCASIAEGLEGWLSGTRCLPSATACRAHVERNFEWDQIATRLLDIYREAGWRAVSEEGSNLT